MPSPRPFESIAVHAVSPFAAGASPSPSIPPAPPSGIALRGRVAARAPFTPEIAPAPLRASQVRAVAAEELRWFFTRTDTDARSLQARAAVEAWLSTLTPEQVEVLELRYDTEPWPRAIRGSRQTGFALVRRLASTRPTRGRKAERAETRHLEVAVERHGDRVLRGLEQRADHLFGAAVRAYAKARGRVLSVVPR